MTNEETFPLRMACISDAGYVGDNKNLNLVHDISAPCLFFSLCLPVLLDLFSYQCFMKYSSFRILDVSGDIRKPSKVLVNTVSRIFNI